MRASLVLGVSIALIACSEAHVPPEDGGGLDAGPVEIDAAGGDDAFVPPLDAFVPDDTGIDAGAPEPCDAPGTVETVSGCGRCGTQTRFCTSARTWEYGPCTDDPGAECDPGTSGSIACGMCGTQLRLCGVDCRWLDSGSCSGETGTCLPGAVERDRTGCAGGSRTRVCGEDCAWGPYGACSTVPTDLDGDGDPYATDCDDGDPAVFSGSTRTCGSFHCGTSGTVTTGTSTCGGPAWSVCERPATCAESACTPGARETRSCASECLPAPSQSRTCRGDGTWGPWSACSSGATARPAECADILETGCGLCGEGTAYTYCDASCTLRTTDCTGTGCTPGTSTRSTAGCPPGQYRESVCTASCTPATGACMPYPPDVDVMILVDVTGSHTSLVRANASSLANDLAAPLLADTDVRVGVATFADFMESPYGGPGDLPFHGVLAPTSDAAMVQSTLTTLAGMGGGDGPEAGVQALYELAGGTPHRESRPFTCASGLEAGGCWRPGSQRVVVMITDITQHNAPDPADPTTIADPYTGITPAPATWAEAAAAMRAEGVALFTIVPAGLTWGTYDTSGQMSILVSDLGQDPASAVVTYPAGTTDIRAAIMRTATNIASYVGL